MIESEFKKMELKQRNFFLSYEIDGQILMDLSSIFCNSLSLDQAFRFINHLGRNNNISGINAKSLARYNILVGDYTLTENNQILKTKPNFIIFLNFFVSSDRCSFYEEASWLQ